ncbi:E3 ubiquitin-protein ligase UPL7 [Pyrus ussuriensis x Pyrus communis]|uniref:HECT-type E3 ubiquitin transferase n=1 Tax=Pyrus ussuriensis x Pyrus communis TaxID=2448454 RepID=A0A5N5HSZ6_9ROSA|nr:E3 ubiquitin-protein ligase UPL7 [Pyrus ussuriensis x Pyrus communis]
MRFVSVLTDFKGWKSVAEHDGQSADAAVKNLVRFMGTGESGPYLSIRRYISTLDAPGFSRISSNIQRDDSVLITASTITLALRPFHLAKFDSDGPGSLDAHYVAEKYCVFLLTIPCLTQRLPAVLISAMRHKSILSPCFQTLLNVDCVKDKQALQSDVETHEKPNTVLCEGEMGSFKMYLDKFRPISQQWHLTDLLATMNKVGDIQGSETLTPKKIEHLGKLELQDIVHLYSYTLRIFSFLNPTVGSFPVLNMLSFVALETYLFPRDGHTAPEYYDCISGGVKKDEAFERKLKHTNNDGVNKWVTVLHKITGKSQAGIDNTNLSDSQPKPRFVHEDSSDVWDIEPVRHGPQGISKDMSCMLYLFCSSYSHLLLILDDIEFYEKQVPFTLEQQLKIASVLNTLVYNGFSQTIGQQDRPLMESAIRCLHLMYERDCRHQFCPSVLWLAPARKNRPPIAVGARTREVFSTNVGSDDAPAIPSIGSVITTTPHVFPFEESKDPELYKNLMYVKHYDGDVEELCLDFTVTKESFGKRHVIELKPGGKDTTVTNKNKMQYIHAIADYKLYRQIFPFSNAFYRGLSDLISPSWLKLFNADEFNQLLSGGNHDIDVDDLRKNTRYIGGYSDGTQTIKIFWEVMKGFEPKERCRLLKFVTSCSRAPLLGFKHLQPTFTIHKVACDIPIWDTMRGHDVERLPSASTCYNTLKLPTYKRPSTLRDKLLYAISSNAGFELS